MLITWQPTRTGFSSLSARIEDYDGQPILNALLLSIPLLPQHRDRAALAAYLAFGTSTGGNLQLPDAMTPAMAHAIQRDAHPRMVHPTPIEFYAKPLPEGTNRLVVRAADSEADLAEQRLRIDQSNGNVVLGILPADLANGAIRTRNSLTLASNANIFAAYHPISRWYPYMAVASLVAEHLECGILVLPPEARKEIKVTTELINLLEAASFRLEFGES